MSDNDLKKCHACYTTIDYMIIPVNDNGDERSKVQMCESCFEDTFPNHGFYTT